MSSIEKRHDRVAAARLAGLYRLAIEVGNEDPEAYLEELREEEPAVEDDFRDAKGHCSRCCQHQPEACSGCPGVIHTRDVSGQPYYGDQAESWSVHCSLCGEISEDEDMALGNMRAAVTIARYNHRDNAGSVVPLRFSEAEALLQEPARLLLKHALQYWEWEEPFSAGLLFLAAIVEGAPRQEVLEALSLDIGAAEGLAACADPLLERQLEDLEDGHWQQLAPAMRARADVLRSAGWSDDADFLVGLIEALSWRWE